MEETEVVSNDDSIESTAVAESVPGCTPNLEIEGVYDSQYVQGDPALTISLTGISNSDCRFTLQLVDASTGAPVDPALFLLQ